MPDIVARNKDQGFLLTGQIAVFEAMWSVLRGYFLPHTIPGDKTPLTKLDPEDFTDAIDLVAERAIVEVLRKAVETPDDPVCCGFLLVNEERGVDNFVSPAGGVDENLLVFIDPVDFTAAASRGLDGSVLISFYDLDAGLRVAVIGDLFRRKIYWRVQGEMSFCMSVMFYEDPTLPFVTRTKRFSPPTGRVLALTPSRRKDLGGSSVNLFLGRPERLVGAATLCQSLWKWKNSKGKGIKNIFSVGGSLGPVRVAEGIWDASVEVVKGFRPWDFAPGAFIAEGAGATIVDETGKPRSFKWDRAIMEGYVRDKFLGPALNACRQKFIVAATPELAQNIVSLLNTDAGESRSNA